ncbi:MAG TPA: V-type ATP synthase subunit F [Kofleriaceae bacterium]|nr:V-type ATP synthase subunit F [Kofleriaceae bacterium]
MKAGLHVICGREAALGIALAGIAPIVATTGDEAAAALARLAHEPAHGGVVLIEQSLHDALPASTRRQLQREGTPILMPFPGPAPLPGVAPEHELLEILRRAIGYRVRLR